MSEYRGPHAYDFRLDYERVGKHVGIDIKIAPRDAEGNVTGSYTKVGQMILKRDEFEVFRDLASRLRMEEVQDLQAQKTRDRDAWKKEAEAPAGSC